MTKDDLIVFAVLWSVGLIMAIAMIYEFMVWNSCLRNFPWYVCLRIVGSGE